jgi:hypothetical protein
MSVRKCQFDQLQAKYACSTHAAYFCQHHYDEHISDRNPHITFKIDNALTQLHFEQLQKEVYKRITVLEDAKQQLACIAAQQISDIEQACVSSMKIIDSQIISYRDYARNNNFEHQALQKVSKILTTRLEIEIYQQLTFEIREEATQPPRENSSNH